MIFRRIVNLIRKLKSIIQIKFLFYKNKSEIGHVLFCQNPNYIELKGNVRIKEYNRIQCFDYWKGKKLSPHFSIGKNVIIQDFFTAFVTCNLEIGDECIFAKNVTIVTENHGINPELNIPYHAQELTSGDVKIGDNCWIGVNSIILPNTIIGDNCVIAANSVVKGVFPSCSMIGGVPAKVIRKYDFNNHEWLRP